MDARQLGLKLIANVTYGYTSANFSGRMPCVEVILLNYNIESKEDLKFEIFFQIADSIVHKGRETLERAIKLVNDNVEWNARVVYGDTDRLANKLALFEQVFTFVGFSMFVVLPGRTKDEAFKIGDAIADEVTKRNPKPVKLKFEKVIDPDGCNLLNFIELIIDLFLAGLLSVCSPNQETLRRLFL